MLWALTQNNLGLSLYELGKCQRRTRLLEKALRCFREALKEQSLESTPLECARTQFNLARSLVWLASQSERPASQLRRDAVTALRIAVIGFRKCDAIESEKLASAELAQVEHEVNS